MKELAIQAAREAGQLMLEWRSRFPPGPATMDYKTAKDVFQTDRYKPDRPSTVFTPDVDAIYVVFEILPRENPAHILGQLFLEKGDGRPNDTLLYEEGVYLQTSQDSGFLELPRPTDGWVPGNYKIRIHIGERVTQASQLGTLRFKVVPSK